MCDKLVSVMQALGVDQLALVPVIAQARYQMGCCRVADVHFGGGDGIVGIAFADDVDPQDRAKEDQPGADAFFGGVGAEARNQEFFRRHDQCPTEAASTVRVGLGARAMVKAEMKKMTAMVSIRPLVDNCMLWPVTMLSNSSSAISPVEPEAPSMIRAASPVGS